MFTCLEVIPQGRDDVVPMMRRSEGKGFQHLEPQIVTLMEVFLTQLQGRGAAAPENNLRQVWVPFP